MEMMQALYFGILTATLMLCTTATGTAYSH